MLNYLGKPRDVMTLAHELGHGVHQVLAAGQGELAVLHPLTLAETASVFGEMLTFRKLLDQAKTPAEKKTLLAGKVEDMINTVVRQIAFYDFECKLHAARAEGELTPEDINALWMSVQAQSLGDAFEFMDGYETFWSYIPHFVHSPFYVYAYAFGDGLVNALYAAYAGGLPDFQEKYFAMLKAGGSMHHKELLAPFGLDASDPKFWDKGLSMIAGFIDELGGDGWGCWSAGTRDSLLPTRWAKHREQRPLRLEEMGFARISETSPFLEVFWDRYGRHCRDLGQPPASDIGDKPRTGRVFWAHPV
jgi:oligoendopeptidase F